MKRIFVIFLSMLIAAAAVGSAYAESDLSPFYGLVFNEPESYMNLDVRRLTNISSPGSHLLDWGTYQGYDSIGFIRVLCQNATIPFHATYDSFEEGASGVVEKGPKDSIVGLPAFYVIIETKTNNVLGTIREKIWYIICEDRYFMIHNGMSNATTETEQNITQHNQIFETFFNSIKFTDELNPGDIGGNTGEDDSDDWWEFGGCNSTGGLFSVFALIVVYALQRCKKTT